MDARTSRVILVGMGVLGWGLACIFGILSIAGNPVGQIEDHFTMIADDGIDVHTFPKKL